MNKANVWLFDSDSSVWSSLPFCFALFKNHVICVPCCHNQPKVGNDFFELISSSDAEEKELSSKSKIVFL